MDLQHRMIELSALDCTVARRFKDHPLLTEVAQALLVEQWHQRALGTAHDPLALYLVSHGAYGASAWVRPLSQVLIERFCLRETLNLTRDEDFISRQANEDAHAAVDLDLHEIEALINECGPFVLEAYCSSLVEYWSAFTSDGQTPWQWYAQHLREQFTAALDTLRQEGHLDDQQLAVAAALQAPHPAAANQAERHPVAIAHLHTDLTASGHIDVDLGSALLLERPATSEAPAATLLYTLLGKLLSFPSRQAMLGIIGRLWPHTEMAVPHAVHIVPNDDQPFEAQALGVLCQQLRVIEVLAQDYRLPGQALALSQDLDRLTAMVELCDRDERTQRKSVGEHLPDWLKQAPPSAQRHYARLLIDTAQTYHDNHGLGWLDGVDTAQDFANRALKARLASDHPGSDLAPEDVLVRNIHVISANIGGEGLGAQGEERLLEYSLADLAIGNLGLLKSSRTTVLSRTPVPLPAWMDEAYVRRLVTELDIAGAYPRMLRERLLDDPIQKHRRIRRLGEQLRHQLPALALEQHLRGAGISEQSVDHLAQMLAPDRPEASPWVMRPFGLLRRPDATPDHPLNTWLIEPAEPSASPCLLYRPLHDTPLLQFDDRLALFDALSTPGPLQDDVLQRLPAEDRKVYAHGGFKEPHLFYPLDDTFAVPFGTPAAAILSMEPALKDIAEAIYQATVEESIARFQAHATTSAETRWNGYKTLGWLLFNTLLPLAGSTLGKVAWLAQMEIALAEWVETDAERDPAGQRIALVNLLVDIALLLLSHTAWSAPLEEGKEASLAQRPPLSPPLKPVVPYVEVTSAPTTLEFSWSAPGHSLSASQHAALERLVATSAPTELGTPVPSGPLAGLYLAADLCWVRLADKVYKVLLDDVYQQPRIVSDTNDATLGPWLSRDEAGRWQLDLRLRLRAGMPKVSRIAQLKADNARKLAEVDSQLVADLREGRETMERLRDHASAFGADSSVAALGEFLAQAQAASAHWKAHGERLEARNKLSTTALPEQLAKDFKVNQARALYQRALTEQMVNATLKRLRNPKRKQLSAFLQSSQGHISIDDLTVYRQRLAELSPLLDQLVENADTLHALRLELEKLKSRGQQEIQRLFTSLEQNWPPADATITHREMRLENNFNRLFAQHPENESDATGNVFWLDLANQNILRVIHQRRRMAGLAEIPEQITLRLLRRMDEWLSEADRQLNNYQAPPSDDARLPLAQVREDSHYLRRKIALELAELPDYPPTQPLSQLRSSVPGLTQDNELGLLLEDPTPAGDGAHLQNETEETEAQVQVAQALTFNKPSAPSLKRLLKDARKQLGQARTLLDRFERARTDAYTPLEIHDLLMQEQRRLQDQFEAIEQHLTSLNQTDQAAAGQDAAQVAQGLTSLGQTLKRQATVLRTRAALQRKPTVGNVLYLLDNGEVTLHPVGTRSRLAKVRGRPLSYLDEYAIRHQGQDLWYAHFHYAMPDTPKPQFLAGHLKTAAQRFAQGRTTTDPSSGTAIEVYRYEITDPSVAARFFSA